MASFSFFQSPLHTQLQTHLEAQIKDQLGQRVRAMTGATGDARDFLQPAGDPGLFGPDSAAWQVHAHFVAMMTGGLSSLVLQALHPRALAAVWDHSSFRTQLQARLGRTALFVATTTYGGTAAALQTIERVNRIHAQIRGTLPDGTPYVANDPELIRWVHLGETTSFMRAYQDLSLQPLRTDRQDLYFAEMAHIGERLGAHDLPLTRHQAWSQLQAFRPDWADRKLPVRPLGPALGEFDRAGRVSDAARLGAGVAGARTQLRSGASRCAHGLAGHGCLAGLGFCRDGGGRPGPPAHGH